MASQCDFEVCLSYALKCVGKEGLKLKAEQREVIKEVYDGNDIFVWLPTGFGKSLCFECLPFVFDMKLGRVNTGGNRSVVVVVSPLVSLMIDQVSSLMSRGVSAAIMSSQREIDKKLLVSEQRMGMCSLLFAAPEAVIGERKWKDKLSEAPLHNHIVAVAVDEAHCVSKWSKTFRPVYANLGELRAVVPSGTPMVAFTVTATHAIRHDVLMKLEMCDSKLVHISPNRSNIYFEARPRTSIEADMAPVVHDLRENKHKAQRVLIYCRSLNTCADLYAHFCYELGDNGSYYPENAEHISDNRLYGMYHAKSPSHKDVILKSMLDANGVVRVVFCTVALGMGVNFAGLNHIIHYGAPSSIEDYYQECGRAGRSGEQAKSVIYWIPADAPLRKNLGNPTNAEIAAVRHFLENTRECRRNQLLRYFDASSSICTAEQDPILCCDVCACKALSKE